MLILDVCFNIRVILMEYNKSEYNSVKLKLNCKIFSTNVKTITNLWSGFYFALTLIVPKDYLFTPFVKIRHWHKDSKPDEVMMSVIIPLVLFLVKMKRFRDFDNSERSAPPQKKKKYLVSKMTINPRCLLTIQIWGLYGWTLLSHYWKQTIETPYCIALTQCMIMTQRYLNYYV